MSDFRIVYKASRDGFHAKDFHSRCDGIASTLTVIKAANGCIFGGFTEQPWSSEGQYVFDDKAFVFSLVNKEKSSFRALFWTKYYGDAIYCHRDFGPCFGKKDISISSESNTNMSSYAGIGSTFNNIVYYMNKSRAQDVLAGAHKFQTVDIEVYSRFKSKRQQPKKMRRSSK